MKIIIKVLLVIIAVYSLLWTVYGLEIWHSRNSLITHYGGMGVGCTAGPTRPPGELSLDKVATYIPGYLKPFYLTKNFDYTINTKNGGLASGYVSPLGKVHETSPGYACSLQ
jgi:hypothetical protein